MRHCFFYFRIFSMHNYILYRTSSTVPRWGVCLLCARSFLCTKAQCNRYSRYLASAPVLLVVWAPNVNRINVSNAWRVSPAIINWCSISAYTPAKNRTNAHIVIVDLSSFPTCNSTPAYILVSTINELKLSLLFEKIYLWFFHFMIKRFQK